MSRKARNVSLPSALLLSVCFGFRWVSFSRVASSAMSRKALVPQESSEMPSRSSPAEETGGARMTPATSKPPLTQPLSGPRQVSAQSVVPSETTRPTTPPSREGNLSAKVRRLSFYTPFDPSSDECPDAFVIDV